MLVPSTVTVHKNWNWHKNNLLQYNYYLHLCWQEIRTDRFAEAAAFYIKPSSVKQLIKVLPFSGEILYVHVHRMTLTWFDIYGHLVCFVNMYMWIVQRKKMPLTESRATKTFLFSNLKKAVHAYWNFPTCSRR